MAKKKRFWKFLSFHDFHEKCSLNLSSKCRALGDMKRYTVITFVTPMFLYFRQSGGVKDFSTCSLDDFKYFASHSGLGCLYNILPDIPVYQQKPRSICGNGILEEGEQCDCGNVEVHRN